MNDATVPAALSALRSVLMVAGTILVGHGYATDGQVADIIGAVMVAAPLIWGIWQKFTAATASNARTVVAVQAGINAQSAKSSPPPIVVNSTVHAQAIIQTFGPAPEASSSQKGLSNA